MQSIAVGKPCIMETTDVAGMCFVPVRYPLALRPNCVIDVLQWFQTFYNQRSAMWSIHCAAYIKEGKQSKLSKAK